MVECKVVCFRHSGTGARRYAPTPFAKEKLKALVESGRRPIHIIHDGVYYFDLGDVDFENALTVRGWVRRWKSEDKSWRAMIKDYLREADKGKQPSFMRGTPEKDYIAAANRPSKTFINHLNYAPFEATIEHNRYLYNNFLFALSMINNRLDQAIHHIIEGTNALAAANLLRDVETLYQASQLDGTVVIFRDLTHSYLAISPDIAFVHEGRVWTFQSFLSHYGIDLEVMVEPLVTTYEEDIVNLLCSDRMLSLDMHRSLAHKQMLLYIALSKRVDEYENGISSMHVAIARKEVDDTFKV